MKVFSGAALFALLLSVGGHTEAAGPNGREIMAKAEQAQTVAQLTSSSVLVIGGGGETRSKSFNLWRKAASDGVHFRTLTRFLAPAEIKGEGVLFDERANGQNEVLLYLPRYKKVRRVESQSQKSSFMGSSFSYADMTTHGIDDYRHEVAKNEPCPGDAKSSCFVVTSTPANESVRANHGYAKKTSWVRTSDFQTLQTELFDESGALWKRVVFSDVREVDATKHKAIPHQVRVDDLKTKRFSTIQIQKADASSSVSDALFNEQSLSREI
jgi:hypothetical protein